MSEAGKASSSTDLVPVDTSAEALEPLGDVLLGVLASVVLATPGVARLEPVLTAGAKMLLGRTAVDGIRVVTRNDSVSVDVNVATRHDAQARSTAHAAADAVRDCLTGRGLQPGSIVVNVLEVAV